MPRDRRLRDRHRRAARLPRQGRRSSPPAGSAGCSRSPPTPTPSPATARRSPTATACRWRTWSSTSSTRRASTGSASSSARACRGDGGVCSTARASASWSATRRSSRTWRRRDVVARAIYQEIREGRGIGGKDYVYLESATHLGRGGASRSKLPDIIEFCPDLPRRRPDQGADADPAHRALRDGRHPHRHRRPGDPRRGHDVVPGLYAAGEMRLRQRPRRQPAGHQLAGRPGRLRPPRGRSTWRDYCREADLPPLPENPTASIAAELERLLRQRGHRAGGQAARGDAGCDAWTTSASSAPPRGWRQALEKVRELQARYQHVGVMDKGKRFNTDLWRPGSWANLLDLAEVTALAAVTRTESRGAHIARTTRSATTRSG